MRTVVMFAVIGLVIVASGKAGADDLAFPKTEQEIVDALSLKDGQIEHNGQTYISEGGKIYKIVRGKRFRMRGLEEIVDSNLAPRAGMIVEFEYGEASIKPEYHRILNEFGKALKAGLSRATLIVAGHTCDIGTDEHNMRLSERRALAVKDYLEKNHAVAPDRLSVKAYGKTKPIASNDTEAGKIRNRRVEFIRSDAM